MEQTPINADESFLLGLDIPFRDDIEQRVDLIVMRMGAATSAEALDQLAIVAHEEWQGARRHRDKTGAIVARAIAASLRFRASRLRGELDAPQA